MVSGSAVGYYGALGAVIGHEISHGFDDQGRKFDRRGSLVDWWTAADAAKYNERAQQIVEQYDAYTVLDSLVAEVTCYHGPDEQGSHVILRESATPAPQDLASALRRVGEVLELAGHVTAAAVADETCRARL